MFYRTLDGYLEKGYFGGKDQLVMTELFYAQPEQYLLLRSDRKCAQGFTDSIATQPKNTKAIIELFHQSIQDPTFATSGTTFYHSLREKKN